MNEKLLKATHEGDLKINEFDITAYNLPDGQRVLSRIGFLKAIGRTGKAKGGRQYDDEFQIPIFLSANNLKPLIDSDIIENSKPVLFIDLNNNQSIGYRAELLPQVAYLFSEAFDKGILKSNQIHIGKQSKILVKAFLKTSIIALVDEATGYQGEREKDELQKILKKYISAELLPWEKRFPDEFYREIFKLNNWDFTVSQINKGSRPSIIGKWTKKYIYSVLPPGVLESLLHLVPRKRDGRLKHKLHQHLSREEGIEHLNKQIISTVAIMGVSKDWDDFEKLWNRKYGQQIIDFDFGVLEPKKEYSNFNESLKKALDYNPKEEKPN